MSASHIHSSQSSSISNGSILTSENLTNEENQFLAQATYEYKQLPNGRLEITMPSVVISVSPGLFSIMPSLDTRKHYKLKFTDEHSKKFDICPSNQPTTMSLALQKAIQANEWSRLDLHLWELEEGSGHLGNLITSESITEHDLYPSAKVTWIFGKPKPDTETSQGP